MFEIEQKILAIPVNEFTTWKVPEGWSLASVGSEEKIKAALTGNTVHIRRVVIERLRI